jgi:hypothetical protein
MKNLIIIYKFLLPAFLVLFCYTVQAEEYSAKSGQCSFSVNAPAKTIYGKSNDIQIQIDSKAGKVYLAVPIRSFLFSNNFVADSLNSIIYDRFNEYYMESQKFPRVTYDARITNLNKISFTKNGTYLIKTSGTLNLHGVDQQVSAEGTVTVNEKGITVTTKITVLPQQYKIRLPPYIGNMYFKEVFIDLNAQLN